MKMKYVTVKSGLESVNGAYLGQFVSNGTSTLDEVAEKMCKDRPAVDEPEAKLAVRALAAEIREQVGVNLNRVNAGPVSFEPAISGSLPAMDSALGPENELYVNVVASDALQKEIAAIVPTRDSASAIAVKMDNVEDLASHGPKIVGTKEFVVTGFNLSARQDGEGMVLLHLDGTSAAEVTVKEEDGMGQRVNAQLVASVASGTYLLQLTTHGYSTPDAEAESYTKKVQVVYEESPEPPEPEITKVTSPLGEGIIKVGQPFAVEGVALGTATQVIVQYINSAGGSSSSVDCDCTVESPEKVTVESLPELVNADLSQPVEVGLVNADGEVFVYLEVTAQE